MSKLLGIAIAALLAAGGVSAQNSTSICAKGLKMFVSRGTGEAMGTGDDTGLGATGKLVKSIAEQIDGSSYQGIPYPADWGNTTTYFQSVGNGTELLRQMITEYATSCPDSKIAVFGYSQVHTSIFGLSGLHANNNGSKGAQVTTNNFCGTAAIWEYFGSIASGSIPDDTEVVEAPSTLPETVTKNGKYPRWTRSFTFVFSNCDQSWPSCSLATQLTAKRRPTITATQRAAACSGVLITALAWS